MSALDDVLAELPYQDDNGYIVGEEVGEAKAELTRLRAEKEEFRQGWYEMKAERDRLRERLVSVEAYRDAGAQMLGEARDKLTRLRGDLVALVTELTRLREENEALRKIVDSSFIPNSETVRNALKETT